jgi:hypothetical protein
MAIAESVLVLTDEEGHVARLPVYKSTMLKFESRYKRAFNTNMVTDAATMSYYLAHEQHWPPSPTELETWFDSVRFEVEEPEPAEQNGSGPTAPPAQD